MTDAVYLRDLDGTGSMHVCSQEDPGACEYLPSDARPMTVAEAAKDKSAERDIVTNIINSGTDHDGYLFSAAETADAILAALKARAMSQGGE